MIIYYKNQGETPLQALNRLRLEKQELITETLSYAGRLDPMAEGLLLVLIGREENRDRKKYLGLDKEYEVEIALGLGSDTHDPLGRLAISKHVDVTKKNIEDFLVSLKGPQILEYPIYSSKTVKGKPLFKWAREGRILEIEIPKKEVVIYEAQLIDFSIKSMKELMVQAFSDINKVKGDFRQDEALSAWNSIGFSYSYEFVPCCTVRISCSSGTYMRSIAAMLGKHFLTDAIAMKIVRTRIGSYRIIHS